MSQFEHAKHNLKKPGLLAIFKYLDDVKAAAEAIEQKKEFQGHEIISHTSYHELMDHAEKIYGPSQVRWFTLVGALTGLFSGFALPLGLDYDWPLVVGGKSPGIYSLPAYFVFGFELMILFGAIATILGMLVMGRLPDPNARVLDPRLTQDRFAIFVPGVGVDSSQAKILKNLGAEEVYCP
ncbi:MAG: DUF3341 domain-containing protein [Oligoflexales bacterium]|nr:DUF3341 domain-containing protein [Oligoflexales bacterium]